MFTPPPSPVPFGKTLGLQTLSPTRSVSEVNDTHLVPSCQAYARRSLIPTASAPASDLKSQTTRRIRWTIVFVPIVLILITVSTRFLSHPAAFDLLTAQRVSPKWQTIAEWRPHKRHADPDPAPVPASSSSASGVQPPTSTGSTASASSESAPTSRTTPQTVPTIPQSPPDLPTPFPQPLDQSLSSNFTTQGCENFFLNMTQSTSFRTCRPLSLLLQTSSAFIEAQDNITALNNIIWGTCNTNLDVSQCDANIAWFASSLQDQCANDMKADNAIVLQTLNGLEAYPLLRNTGCLADQATGAYCYIEAVHNTQPADLYFYSLPLGTQLPANIVPSCSACTKSVMALYAQQGANLSALQEVYNGAATVANKACGQGYTQVTSTNSAASIFGSSRGRILLWIAGIAGFLAA